MIRMNPLRARLIASLHHTASSRPHRGTPATPARCPCVVLTGGPGGGKSALMAELRASDPRAGRWILVPEAAPLLFRAGLKAHDKSFQIAVVHLQLGLEVACSDGARPGQLLVCHRGALDPLAYWRRNGWDEDEFFTVLGMRREALLARYQAVIHLQTAAIDAEGDYHRVPEAHRPETPAQAAEIDVLCAAAWNTHPRYTLIGNAGRDWSAKAGAAGELLQRWRSS